MPKFSIVCPHYQPSIGEKSFNLGMDSLLSQSFKDFEVLIYHDGPEIREDKIPEDPRFTYKVTKKRENVWGHNNRDRGIKESTGEYIVHFNPDNILYPEALEEINNEIKKNQKGLSQPGIIIFPVFMQGMFCNGREFWRDKDSEGGVILTGFPPVRNLIDCMQLVGRRDVWESVGGWRDFSENSDGAIYPALVKSYGARYCSKVLGEHR